MTNMDPVMKPIFTKMIPCPGVGILKMIPCSAARPRTEKYMSTPPPGTPCIDNKMQLEFNGGIIDSIEEVTKLLGTGAKTRPKKR